MPQVKSLTFATMRDFLPERLGPDRWQRLRDELDPDVLALLDEVEPGTWVAEDHMHQLMAAMYRRALDADDEAFLAVVRGLAAAGISRFMRVFLGLTSARFVLKKVPVVWRQLRRNAGEVESVVEGQRVRVRYRGFPYFAEPAYRLLSLGNCQALAFAASSRIPQGTIGAWGGDHLELEFDLAANPDDA